MKTNELMTGDIVRVAKDVSFPKGTIVSVRGIDADNRFPERHLIGSATCLPVNSEDGFTYGVWVEYLEPIPLTADILEKNGFVYKEAEKTCATDTFHLWWLDGSIFALDDDSWWRSVKDDKLRVKFGGFPLEYVHQLQQIMRLLGIEKEIIL